MRGFLATSGRTRTRYRAQSRTVCLLQPGVRGNVRPLDSGAGVCRLRNEAAQPSAASGGCTTGSAGAWAWRSIARWRSSARACGGTSTRPTTRTESLFWLGTKDTWDLRHLCRLVRPGGVAIDAGSNFGYHALDLAGPLGRDGRIHALEPNPANYERLCRSLPRTASKPTSSRTNSASPTAPKPSG